ncbi:MAG: alkaline phosphatase family protein [Acidobacteriaceae bacterium]
MIPRTSAVALLLASGLFASGLFASGIISQAQTSKPIVLMITMENRNWTGDVASSNLKGNSLAPYFNGTLIPMGAHAEDLRSPYHPSLPNYLYMEAGSTLGITSDVLPSQKHFSTHSHFTELLQNAGVPWAAYVEGITGTDCPLLNEGPKDANGSQLYAPKHFPMMYFDDMTDTESKTSAYCIAHARPFSKFAGDLAANRQGNYVFIVGDLCDVGHDTCGGNRIAHFDGWLKQIMPAILNSAQYKAGDLLVVIKSDEAGNGGDGPIPLLLLGAGVKKNYSNQVPYTQASILRTLEEIFRVSPMLGDAEKVNDLRDMFPVTPLRR